MFSYTISEIIIQKQYHEISLQYFKENGSYILIDQYKIGGFQKLITIAIRGDSMSYSQSILLPRSHLFHFFAAMCN